MHQATIDSGAAAATSTTIWRPSWTLALLFVAALILSPIASRDGVTFMWGWWVGMAEYSYGILMPVIAVFLIWQQRDKLERLPFTGSWWGFGLTLLAALVLIVGKLAAAYTLEQYAFVLTLGGLGLSLLGPAAARRLVVPFVILVLMVPLPQFLLIPLSAELQLLSSQVGVWVMRLCGVSVFLQGNVIDLGSYKLEVAEACSGLRYLFPLVTLAFIMAYFFKAAFWKRMVVFLSSVPITILMNSLRIAMIGVMVDRWGSAMAEGFLHDFEGWAIFMVSGAVLLLEIIILSRFGRDRRHWREIFGLEFPEPTPAAAPRATWQVSPPFIGTCALLLAVTAASVLLPNRTEAVPARMSFAEFPGQLGPWKGRRSPMQSTYLDVLQLSDYLIADYRKDNSAPVNLYVAWYDTQRGGRSTHSPSTCLPAGGWHLVSLRRTDIADIRIGSQPLTVNRAVMESGGDRELVYYWFQQRGRVITNEYLVKWYLFWDSLTRNRTDGALVRLIAPVATGQDVSDADRELREFLRSVTPRLGRYVPD
jgi:exosortase D (VPLPA-CTERM-specific)